MSEDRDRDLKAKYDQLRAVVGDDGMGSVAREMKVVLECHAKRIAAMSPEGRETYRWLRRQPPGARVRIGEGEGSVVYHRSASGWAPLGSHGFGDTEISLASMSERWGISRLDFYPPDPNGDLMEKMSHRTFKQGIALGFWGEDGQCLPESTHESIFDALMSMAAQGDQ